MFFSGHDNNWMAGESSFKKKKAVVLLIWLLQCAAEIFLFCHIEKLNVLPDRYLLAAAGSLVLCALITGGLFLLFSPGKRGRRGNAAGKGAMIGRVFAMILAVCVMIASLGGSYAASRLQRTMKAVTDASDDTTEGSDAGKNSDTGITEKPFLLYLSGSDTRSEMLTTSRSDVNILAAVNPVTKQILLINTPRDYYIANPAKDGELDKFTHCGIYGIDCSIQALEDLYDEDITCYAQINFTGFETLIDAVGGVTVHSDTAFKTSRGTEIVKGDNDLNGKEALILVRERYNLPNGDNDRGKNQMKVLKEVVKKLSSGKTLLMNYSDILESLEGMFITDVSSDEIAAFVKMQLDDMESWNVLSYAVTGTGGRAETASMPGRRLYVCYPDQSTVKKAKKLIDQVMEGTVLDAKDLKK